MITDLIPISLPPKYGDLVRPITNWGRDLMRAIENKADTAQEAADGAQADATLSLGQIQSLAEQNAADLKKANFLRQWYGS